MEDPKVLGRTNIDKDSSIKMKTMIASEIVNKDRIKSKIRILF